MKKTILRFLIIIMLYYFLLYLFSRIIMGDDSPTNWSGIAVIYLLVWCFIPLFTIIIGVVCGIKNYNFLFLILLAFANTILCWCVLLMLFPKYGIGVEYALCIIGLMIIPYLVVCGIKKIILRL